jgi:hypothetical protein
MDGLLWHFQIVWSDSRIRQLVEATHPDVLLETMAQTENTHRQFIKAGNTEATCFLNGLEPEGILAVVADDGNAYGNVK